VLKRLADELRDGYTALVGDPAGTLQQLGVDFNGF
jgi:hypothetical protein